MNTGISRIRMIAMLQLNGRAKAGVAATADHRCEEAAQEEGWPSTMAQASALKARGCGDGLRMRKTATEGLGPQAVKPS